MTTESKHTEGPWEVDGFAIVGGGQTICMMGEIDGFERGYTPCKNDGPNGKLITAAPDLLAALKDALRSSRKDFKTGPDGDRQHREAYAEQFAALAKARGA